MKNTKYVFALISLFFLLSIVSEAYGQEETLNLKDSISLMDFKSLDIGFHNIIDKDLDRAKVYAEVYLQKAKVEESNVNIAFGYYLLSRVQENDFEKRLIYIDSAITSSSNLQHKKYPVFYYTHKGFLYGRNGLFEKSLDAYLDGLNFAKKTENDRYISILQHNIALLNRKIGNNAEAKKLFNESLQYEKKLMSETGDSLGYLLTLSELVTTYRRNKEIDSANYLNKVGKKSSKNKTINSLFVFNDGILDYYKKNYSEAISKIDMSLKVFLLPENQSYFENYNLIDAYLYLGKSYNELGQKNQAIKEFKKIDSLTKSNNYLIPESRKAYREIIDFYKQRNDYENQLFYINQLLVKDSIFNNNYRTLSKRLLKDYDTPLLLEEKEKIIEELKRKKRLSSMALLSSIFVILISIYLIFYQYRKNRRYKIRFKKLLEEGTDDINKTNLQSNDIEGISTDIVNEIKLGLDEFEKRNGFLLKNLTSSVLAEELNTNQKYLSKIIKHYYKKNFVKYINDLRITYIIEQLKNYTNLRKYTVKAIANEAGFNSAEVFSKSFFKQTGIYPSYFIKKINSLNSED